MKKIQLNTEKLKLEKEKIISLSFSELRNSKEGIVTNPTQQNTFPQITCTCDSSYPNQCTVIPNLENL